MAVHDAKAGSLIERHVDDRDGRVRAGLLVLLEHFVVIHLVDMVAGQDQHILRVVLIHEADVLVNGIRRALIPL